MPFFENEQAMYEFKDLYTIDFKHVKNYFEMHFIIRDALDWPAYYGCNWDAFWDCLTDMVGRPVHIKIVGFEVLEDKFVDEAAMILETLKEFKHYSNDKYANDIQIEVVRGELREQLL